MRFGGIYFIDEGTGAVSNLVHVRGLEVFADRSRLFADSSGLKQIILDGRPVSRGP
jgi:hypothetical protein